VDSVTELNSWPRFPEGRFLIADNCCQFRLLQMQSIMILRLFLDELINYRELKGMSQARKGIEVEYL